MYSGRLDQILIRLQSLIHIQSMKVDEDFNQKLDLAPLDS